MSLAHQDLDSHYVFGGRCYDPNKNETLFERNTEGCFSTVFGTSVNNDEDAIQDADRLFQTLFNLAGRGYKLSATLWFNGRMVKNYPEVIKT